MATTMSIHSLHPQMMTLRLPLSPQATTRGSISTSHNSHITHAGLSCYEPPSITLGGVPNTNHNLYSQHKIRNITGHYPWLPNQVEPTYTSHNSHTHTSFSNIIRPQLGIATYLPSISSHNSRNGLSKSPPPKSSFKAFKINSNPFWGPPSSCTRNHNPHHAHPNSTHVDDILKMTLAATSSNSWFHHLLATTCR